MQHKQTEIDPSLLRLQSVREKNNAKELQASPVLKARVLMVATRHTQIDLLEYLVRTLGADISAVVPTYTIWDAPSQCIYACATSIIPASVESVLFQKSTTPPPHSPHQPDDFVLEDLL